RIIAREVELLPPRVHGERRRVVRGPRVQVREADRVVLRLDSERAEPAPLHFFHALCRVEQRGPEVALLRRALEELRTHGLAALPPPPLTCDPVGVEGTVPLVEERPESPDLEIVADLLLSAARHRPLVVDRRVFGGDSDGAVPALAEAVELRTSAA